MHEEKENEDYNKEEEEEKAQEQDDEDESESESESEEEAPARRSSRAAAIRGNQALQCITVRPLRVYGQWVPRRLAGASRD